MCPSSVVTVTFRSVVPVPIFFHVDLDTRLQDAPVSTKNGKFRLLMVTGTDGDDSVVVSSSLLMVGFVTRLILEYFCFVMQAALIL